MGLCAATGLLDASSLQFWIIWVWDGFWTFLFHPQTHVLQHLA